MPRNKDPIWTNFECIKTKNTGLWAKCRKCKKEMQGILNRLKKHSITCYPPSQASIAAEKQSLILNLTEENEKFHLKASQTIHSNQSKDNRIQSKLTISKDTNVIITSRDYEKRINLQIAKYFYVSNTSFNYVEHGEFLKLCALLRPGYRPPSAYVIGDTILNKVHTKNLDINKN